MLVSDLGSKVVRTNLCWSSLIPSSEFNKGKNNQ